MKKTIITKINSICLLLAAGLVASQAFPLNWDPGLTGSASGGGTGTWNLNTTANWFNGTADAKWTDNSAAGTDQAIFANSAGTVTLNSSLSASNLQFTATGYSLSGTGTLTLGAGGIDATALSSGTTAIGTTLSLPVAQEPWQVGAGGTLAINGAVTRSVGATVDFSATGITTTSPNLTNDAGGILDGWATSGNYISSTTTGDFLSVSNGNIVISTNYLAVSASASSTPSVASITGQNLVCGQLNGANEITTYNANVAVNSLIAQGDNSVNNGVTLTINSGGLILRGQSRWILDNGGGNLGTAVLNSGLASGEFFIHTPNPGATDWRIWPQIHDNGATPGIVVKEGPGIANLQNTNSYSGGTIINGGFLSPGRDNSVTNPCSLGTGTVTVNPAGVLEVGFGTANANIDYFVTNTLVIAGGKALSDDGHQHLSGPISIGAAGATFGSTYDGGGSPTTGNKALFIDGLVSGSGPITLEQSVEAGDLDRYGNGNGNFYNSSVVEFGNNANTYSGTITIVPYNAGAGSYVAVNGSTAIQYATLDVEDSTGTSHRYSGTSLIFNTGLGSATLGALTGAGSTILNGFNENTYALQSDPIALSVGNNNSSTTYSGVMSGSGSLTKLGTGTFTMSGVNTYTGNTTLNAGVLVLTGGWLNSVNVTVAAGTTLDVSGVSPVTMAGGQILYGGGTFNGTINTSSGSLIYAGTDGGYGTNAITGSLTLASGAVAYFDVGTVHNGSNDLITVGGTLTVNNNLIHLKAPSTSVNLDSSADYVLFSSPNTISGTFATTPTWDVVPVNSAHYSIVTGTKTVTLHYSAVAGPSGVGAATPSPALRNQNVLLKVTAANGTAGTVNSVVVDASSIGGSSTLALVDAGGNVWTNTVTVTSGTTPGSKTLVATLTDTASLSGFVNIPLTVAVGNDVWNGGGADNNFSSSLNWTNQTAPGLVGDSLEFAGNTRLSPNLDNNYTLTGILFDKTAGSFNIGTANSSTLTLTNGSGVVNNSANVQTLSIPITLGASETFNTASNDIVVSGVVGDGSSPGGLTKTGKHVLTLSGADTYTGSTTVNGGLVNIAGSAGALVSASSTFVGSTAGNSTLNVAGSASLSAYYLLLGNVSNAVGAVYQTGGSVNASAASGFDNLSVGNVAGAYGYFGANGGTFTVDGICVGGEVNTGGGANFNAPGGNGIFEVNGGSVADSGWFVIARQNGGTVGPSIGELNVYGGSLTYAGGGIVGPWDTGETAIINILGGSVTDSAIGVGVYLGNTGSTGILNLNGGVLEANVVEGYNGPTYNPNVTNGLVNFNGGTLQASENNPNFVSVTTANIYSGGATIDNNGNIITISQSLVAPAGNGIHGIASFTGGAGYIAPPIIIITNGTGDTTGTGATAIAQINPVTGTVTNVVITSPGVSYTATPVFLVSGGGATTPATITGTAPTANVSGGLTAVGSGTTTLAGTNTYTGNTVVSNGTLEIVLPVLATGSTVSIASGAVFQLDFSTSNQVAGLVLNGVSQSPGVYTSVNASPYITGSGSLVVSAGPGMFTTAPDITSFTIHGANIVLTGTSGQANDAYYLLTSTNLTLPFNQWRTVATNVLSASGTFTFTGTNAVTAGSHQQFYRLSNTNYNP